jgi:hypothetical protein
MSSKKLFEKMVPINRPKLYANKNLTVKYHTLQGNTVNNPKYILGENHIGHIFCDGDIFKIKIELICGEEHTKIVYTLQENFDTFDEAKTWLMDRDNQLALINLALLKNHETCKNPNYKTGFNIRKLNANS